MLRTARLARPGIGPDEVLVRVRASSVDRGTWHMMAGLPYAVRAVSGLRRPKLPNPGRSIAGVVEAVGSDVTRFAPGDEVYGTAVAAFADYAATGSLPSRPDSPSRRRRRYPSARSLHSRRFATGAGSKRASRS